MVTAQAAPGAQGSSPTASSLPSRARGTAAPSAGNSDTSAITADRPSGQINAANAGTTAPVSASHSYRNGAGSAEDNRRTKHVAAAAVGHTPPHVLTSFPGVSQVHEPPFSIPRSIDKRREQHEPLVSQEIKWPDTPSDDGMLLDSDLEELDSASLVQDTGMLDSDSESDALVPLSDKGKGVQNPPAPRPTMSYSEGANRSAGQWSTTEWSSSTLQGSSRAFRKPQDTFPSLNGDRDQQETPRMCIVCGVKPPYSKNGKSYPTCGLTCAADLDQRTRERDTRGSDRHSSYSRMCVVCHTRPKHVSASTGRPYPTCGYSCAAKLDPAGMCTVCKKPSKFATGAVKYCSTACKDKAKAALANAVTVTCSNCLACWTKPALTDQPYCSDHCLTAMLRWAPTLIEMPRGHFLFDKYHKQFQAGWDTTSTRQVVVQHMYCFAQTPAVLGRYETYKDALQRLLNGKSQSETEGWVAITRECNVGDSGSVIICSSPSCHFCNIMQNSFVRHDSAYLQGIPVASTAAKASEGLRGARQGPTKALLFVKVCHGPQDRLREYTESALFGSQRARDDVVAVVSWRRTRTELRVYNPEAILPLGLLVYSEK